MADINKDELQGIQWDLNNHLRINITSVLSRRQENTAEEIAFPRRMRAGAGGS
jgi:hypothetical protein